MELELFLELCPDVIVKVFVCITVIIGILAISKVALAGSKTTKKEVKTDDSRRDKKRSTKTDVH